MVNTRAAGTVNEAFRLVRKVRRQDPFTVFTVARPRARRSLTAGPGRPAHPRAASWRHELVAAGRRSLTDRPGWAR